MKAIFYYGPKELKLVDVDVPQPGPGEVLIKVAAALTCGTDMKAFRQGHPVLLRELPAPFGHELAGTIEAVGEGVAAKFQKGARVVSANSAPCGACAFCDRGQNQLCDDLRLHNGAYAEYILIPAPIVKHNLYLLKPDVPFTTAALSEPLACALHGIDVMRVEKGERVTILGAGSMSLLLTQALRALGAKVFVIGRSHSRLKTSERAGAERVASIYDIEPAGAVKEWTGGLGADCVFEAVGRPETWQQAVGMVRKGGRVCLFGGCAMGSRLTVDAHRVHYEQLTLQGVFHHTPKYFAQAVALLSEGRIDPDLLISDTISLERVPSYFESMKDQSGPKVAVIP